MRKIFTLALLIAISYSCKEEQDPRFTIDDPDFISGIDISRYPEIRLTNPSFYDHDGIKDEFLNILNQNGVNTIRLRLWVNPENVHSGFDEVKSFSEELKSLGFRIWLTVHYSDSWADPGKQHKPLSWSDLSYEELKVQVESYTRSIGEQISPDFIQIGNEINSGFLHPDGNLSDNPNQFIELLDIASQAIRSSSPESKIMLHFAGHVGSSWFFEQVKSVDYDLIGLSFYPFWHGKDLHELQTQMNYLGYTYNKNVVIAETAYPFTLDWNDWTNNIVGLEDHLILPDFPASPEGQRDFIHELKVLTTNSTRGKGFCYWGGELIAWKGSEATNASPWENQALFDFENKALPVLNEFKLK